MKLFGLLYAIAWTPLAMFLIRMGTDLKVVGAYMLFNVGLGLLLGIKVESK